jgi:3-oxoacyl-[acyl-carrier protein] reductase
MSVAIVTGAGRGIGRAVAGLLASEGATVALIARTDEQLQEAAAEIRTAGGTATPMAADVASPDGVAEIAGRIERELDGPCEILVNAAGITGPVDELADVDPEEWLGVVDINLNGAFLMCRAVLPAMRARRSGRIVNVTSGLARRVQPGLGPYSIAKAGLAQMSQVMDAESREHGVRVFAIEPGVVRTDMNEFLTSQATDGVRGSVVQMLRNLERDPGVVPVQESARLICLAATGGADDLAGEPCSIYDPAVRARLSDT